MEIFLRLPQQRQGPAAEILLSLAPHTPIVRYGSCKALKNHPLISQNDTGILSVPRFKVKNWEHAISDKDGNQLQVSKVT